MENPLISSYTEFELFNLRPELPDANAAAAEFATVPAKMIKLRPGAALAASHVPVAKKPFQVPEKVLSILDTIQPDPIVINAIKIEKQVFSIPDAAIPVPVVAKPFRTQELALLTSEATSVRTPSFLSKYWPYIIGGLIVGAFSYHLWNKRKKEKS